MFFLSFQVAFSQELVEFRGIDRTGIYNGNGLLKQWPENGPELLLKIEGIGKGYSHPIVAENKIFVTGQKNDTIDVMSAYNLKGNFLWETPYGRSWIRTYSESRSTPTYSDGNLYVASGTGQIACVNAENGKLVWVVNSEDKYGTAIYNHGDAESPLVYKDVVIYTTGGERNTIIALNKNNGSLAWKTKSLGGAKSYASPVLINHNGVDIIVAQTSEKLFGILAENGSILWHTNLIQYHTHRQGKGGNTNPPIYFDGELFVTSGYDHPGIMYIISEDGELISEKWKNYDLDNHHGGVVHVDGNLYGANWQNNSKGRWASINWETGETNWETEWYNKGSIIFADGMLYMLEEKSGTLALVNPSLVKFDIVSSIKITEGNGPYWSHPAIYDGKLFVRHGEVLMIYNIKNDES